MGATGRVPAQAERMDADRRASALRAPRVEPGSGRFIARSWPFCFEGRIVTAVRGRATVITCDPRLETVLPAHSLRNAGLRHGRVRLSIDRERSVTHAHGHARLSGPGAPWTAGQPPPVRAPGGGERAC